MVSQVNLAVSFVAFLESLKNEACEDTTRYLPVLPVIELLTCVLQLFLSWKRNLVKSLNVAF